MINPHGERIRAARIKKGLTQDEVHKATKISTKTIVNLEKGRSVHLRTLQKMEKFYEVAHTFFLRDDDKEVPETSQDPTPLPVDESELIGIVSEIARSAGDVVMESYGKPMKVTLKGGWEVVTKADLDSERFIIKQLEKKFPGHSIVAEEQTDGEKWKCISADNEWTWFVDPLDGTSNFSRHDPHFSVSIALVKNRKPYLGVVYRPVKEELLSAAPALPGGEVRLNGEILKPPPRVEDISSAVIATDWPWSHEHRLYTASFIEELRLSVRQVKMQGSAVSDLCDVACGKLDAYFNPGLFPWDIAAASVIATAMEIKLYDEKGPWNFSTDRFQMVLACAPSIADPIHQFVVQAVKKDT